VFKRVWKIVETKVEKVRVVEIEKGRGKEVRRKEGAREKTKEEKTKKKRERTIEVRKMAKEWEIWDEEKEAAKSKEKAKKLVPQRSYKWIHIFGKKASERMLTRKLWNYTIETKEGFVLRKGKVYSLSRKKRCISSLKNN